ncbi:hypothetical protein U876_07875 [Aeromonas hydrophila NJ-35]|nr:hypothetical protein AHML_14705 [Aeromonas hydrophila ML09-119]AHX33374.1 hypothetical protein V428_15215 [Aeromonas hydrophila subsp. hydrophila AL09-71]AHX70174.1 hypothetical protein V429_15240 [Aeromonas hydrophila pc104A]AJE35809.1 hypothetical protein V469_07905 [Aeromonas hydrophila J-1]AKJ34006.1 hypothetical protein U876_07875 [Aeromonas hydrophila NJ-35]ALQ62894.1 hypothetical protein AS145_08360 [Aeromonas hydrophila]
MTRLHTVGKPSGKEDQGLLSEDARLRPLVIKSELTASQQMKMTPRRIILAMGVLAQVASKKQLGSWGGMRQQNGKRVHI